MARRNAVMAEPVAMIQSVTVSGWLRPFQTGFGDGEKDGTVIVAMRCCLAIGPEKSAAAPQARRSSRV